MKVLVLGGGHCQLNMVKRLKQSGYYIILVDYLEDCPARKYADEHFLTSTFDHEGVMEIIDKTKAGAIITMGTDQPVLTAAIAAKHNKLPFYTSPETALKVTNKRVMKKIFKDSGIPANEYALIDENFTEKDIRHMGFPAVLKPVDSQGQRGIFKVESMDEIQKNIGETLGYTKEDKVLLEEYYENDEITVNGWVRNGKAFIITVVDRVTMDNRERIGICIAHNHPSVHLAEYADDISRITQRIVDAFDIKEGPIYFQYLIGNEGIKVNEIAMRIGGAYEDLTIPLISDIDILGMVFDSVMGNEADVSKLQDYDFRKDGKYMSTQMFFMKPGIVDEHISMEQFTSVPYIKAALFNFKKGTIYKKIENATARAGYFIVVGRDRIDLEKKIRMAYDSLIVSDEKGNSMVITYDEYLGKYKFSLDY